MNNALYRDFLASGDTLRTYDGRKLLFSSAKERLAPLMEYIASGTGGDSPVTIYDKVMGNAAALLSVRANAREVFSPLGSELAVKTLSGFGVVYHIDTTVPFILRPDGVRMCPMEELSIGKSPDELYAVLKARKEKAGTGDSC